MLRCWIWLRRTRTSADRGKALGVSVGDENALSLLDAGGGEDNPVAATGAEADAGVEVGLRSWSPALVRRAVLGWFGGASVAWSKLTGVPSFGSRWPSYGEVTGWEAACWC